MPENYLTIEFQEIKFHSIYTQFTNEAELT